MVNYQEGKIYKLSNKINEKFYIGSTTTELSKRKSKYQSNIKNSSLHQEINSIGWLDEQKRQIWIIELIENFPCNSKNELEAREGFYIRKYRQETPSILLNIRNVGNPELSKKEAVQKYRKANEKKIKEHQIEYRSTNKEVLNAKKREIVTCDICNSEVTRNSLSEHKKSQYCQEIAIEKGLIEEVVVLKKNVSVDKKEYDRQRYLKNKENGDYESGKTGPRQYESCEFILQRSSKDGKKKGDKCEKNCILKAGETVAYCSMHIRVLAKKNADM